MYNLHGTYFDIPLTHDNEWKRKMSAKRYLACVMLTVLDCARARMIFGLSCLIGPCSVRTWLSIVSPLVVLVAGCTVWTLYNSESSLSTSLAASDGCVMTAGYFYSLVHMNSHVNLTWWFTRNDEICLHSSSLRRDQVLSMETMNMLHVSIDATGFINSVSRRMMMMSFSAIMSRLQHVI